MFLKNLGVDFRLRELAYLSMPICSFFYGVTPKSMLNYLELILIGAFFMAFIIFSYKGVRAGIIHLRKNEFRPIIIPELYELANKMNYRLVPNPFLLTDEKNVTARIDRESKKVIFGNDFLNKLTSEEKIFVGAHEFSHLYGRQNLYFLIATIPFTLISFAVPFFLNTPLGIAFLGSLGSMIISGLFAVRSIELLADQAGLIHVSKETAISALKKAYPGRTDKPHNDSHPSVDKRIEKLQ